MSKANEPVLTPLVAEGFAAIARYDAKTTEIELKAKELEALRKEQKAIEGEIEAVNAQLIELGPGPYVAEDGHRCTVLAEIAKTQQPDTFVVPAGTEPRMRELAGDGFKKLFDVKQVLVPRNGFDAIAELLLPKKACRELVSTCLVPGKLTGGRVACVRWKQ